jgi:sec-independent protein translocase protein TatA
MFANFGAGHWLVLGVVMVLMFAGSKLPEAARYAGKSLRIFKSELHELHTDARWPRKRSPRPPGPGGAVHRPCGSGVHPNQHRCLTVNADPVPASRSSTRRTPDCATRCLRRGAVVITGPVVEPACNPGGYL